MFRHDLKHTGRSSYVGSDRNYLKWVYQVGSSSSTPAIGTDGTIYVGSYDNNLYAINPDGSLKWKYTTGDAIESSPAVDVDGVIYVGSNDDKIYAVNSNGTLKWSYTTGGDVVSSPAVGINSTVYVGSYDGKLYVFNKDGTLKKDPPISLGNQIHSSPAVGNNEIIYIGSRNDKKFYSLDSNLETRWSRSLLDSINSSPAIGSDGTVYVGSDRLYAFTDTNYWTYSTTSEDEPPIDSSPAISAAGNIYFGAGSGFYALYSDSSNKEFSVQKIINTIGTIGKSSPAIDANGNVYICTNSGLYALDTNYDVKWTYPIKDENASPIIGADGTIYVHSSDGKLYAVGDASTTTTTTSTTSTTAPTTTTTTSTTVPTTTTSTTTTTTAPTTTTSSTSTTTTTTSTTSTTTSTTSTTTTTIPACTDSYESNDSFSAAYGPITSGSSYSGKICSASDVDYFKITVARAGIISFTLSVPSDRDYDLYLYNSSQSELAYSSLGAGATDFITYLASTTGTYYIKVFGYSGDYDESQTYTLSGTWLSTASTPTVTTGSASNITTNSVTLNGTVNDNGVSTTAWFQYGTTSGSYGSTSSTQSVSGPNTTVSISVSGLSSGTTYYYRIAAQNSAGTTYGNEMSFTTSDASRPTGSVNINSGASYTNSTTVTLNLSATDNAGVTGYYRSTSSTTPSVSTSGWTSISSTTSYTADVSYTVSSGDGSKAVYVWYKDTSGNVSNTASDEITLDTIIPTIIITTPTSSSTYTTTSSTMGMDGTALDNASGISSVTWSNSKGGNGTATGTTSWSVSSITLSSGDNTITVTAKDNAGNTGTDAIAVTYSGAVASPTPTPTPSATPSLTPSPSPKATPSPKVSPSPTPTRTVTPVATPKTSPTPVRGNGVVLGFVYDPDSEPLTGVSVTIAGNDFSESTETDSNGYYEFDELAAGDYTLTCEKDGYETQTLSISLGEDKVFVVDDVTMEESETGKIYGYVVKINGNPIESARLKLKGIKTKVVKNTSSDADGFFEFTGLGADTYVIFAKKTRYKKAKATVKLEEGESEEIEIEMKRTSKRIIGMIEDAQ